MLNTTSGKGVAENPPMHPRIYNLGRAHREVTSCILVTSLVSWEGGRP